MLNLLFKFLNMKKKYKLLLDSNEYLVTIEQDNGKIVTTVDASGNYRNVLKSKLVEV